MKLIPLTQGKFAIVDDEDYELLNQYKWYARKERKTGNTYYAMRNSTNPDGRRITVLMHKFLTSYSRTDHINGNGLDNRRENLREVTHRQNIQNSVRQKGKISSAYKGVRLHKSSNKWQSRISVEGKAINIGYFDDEIVAATAYDTYARFYHKEYAVLNFPKSNERPFLIEEGK